MGQDDKQQDTTQPTTGGQMRDEDTSMGRDAGTLGEKGGQAQRTSDQANQSHASHYDDDMSDEDR